MGTVMYKSQEYKKQTQEEPEFDKLADIIEWEEYCEMLASLDTKTKRQWGLL